MTAEDAVVRTTFFGTSSVHITDGATSVFTDAFLTRPPLWKIVLGRIAPDPSVIADVLRRSNVTTLDAVFAAHSHYDHALDCAEVVTQVGGVVHGSESTLNVARGAGLGEDALQLAADGDEFEFGAFRVRVFEGLHSPDNRFPGSIDAPLSTPAKASAYKDGGCFSYLVTHPSGSIFIHPSANFVPGKFDGLHADVLYLGVGIIGAQPPQFRQDYWHHVVEALSPKVIIPIHWDNFGRPLTKKLRPLPRFIDKFAVTKQFLGDQTRAGGPTVRWQDALETLTPFDL